MAQPVKPRAYNSPRRREQAAATRRDILEAAKRLFEERGYAATTMADIAREAGVALKTVYIAFETKPGLLRALWNVVLRGDQDEVTMRDRAWYREVLAEPDAERTLRLYARNSRIVKQRIGGVFDTIREAAPLDEEVRALWGRIQDDFYDTQRSLVKSIAGDLRPGLSVAAATDILWTLNSPEVWGLLVGQRGWSAKRWERWFADTSVAQLLG